MAKKVVKPTEIELTVDEYCVRKFDVLQKNAELLGAFKSHISRLNICKKTVSEFDNLFNQFKSMPA